MIKHLQHYQIHVRCYYKKNARSHMTCIFFCLLVATKKLLVTDLLKTETWSRSRPGTMSTSAKNTTTIRSHVNGTMCTRSGHFAKTFSDFKKINSPSKELSQELFHKTPCTSSKYDPPSTSLSHCKSL